MFEDFITLQMAQVVMEQSEVIDVEQNNQIPVSVSLTERVEFAELGGHGAPIEQPGQAVAKRELFEFRVCGLQFCSSRHHCNFEIATSALESSVHGRLEFRQVDDPDQLVLVVHDWNSPKAAIVHDLDVFAHERRLRQSMNWRSHHVARLRVLEAFARERTFENRDRVSLGDDTDWNTVVADHECTLAGGLHSGDEFE